MQTNSAYSEGLESEEQLLDDNGDCRLTSSSDTAADAVH